MINGGHNPLNFVANFNNRKLPNQVFNGLKSKGETAQKVATFIKNQKEEIRNAYGDMALCNMFNKPIPFEVEYSFLNASGNPKFSLYSGHEEKFKYENGEGFIQKEYSYSYNNIQGHLKRHMKQFMPNSPKYNGEIFEFQDDKLMTTTSKENRSFFNSTELGLLQPPISVPRPILMSKRHNDNFIDEKTQYLSSQNIDISNSGRIIFKQMTMDEVNKYCDTITKDSTLEEKIFKKQVDMVNQNFQEILNKHVAFATKIIDTPDVKNIETQECIIDLSEAGDRVEVQKDGNFFSIQHYDEDNNLLMDGKFTLLRDENGVPLKEDGRGNILSQNDENYNNESNKLCFNMELETYYNDIYGKSDAERVEYKFKHAINLDDKKHRHELLLYKYDRNGFEEQHEASLPLYSKEWLTHRMPKVFYNTYKTDLKEIRDNMYLKKLEPEDIKII